MEIEILIIRQDFATRPEAEEDWETVPCLVE